MKPSSISRVEKTKRRKNRSQSEPKTYRNFVGHRVSLLNFSYAPTKRINKTKKTPSNSGRNSIDSNYFAKSYSSALRPRQLKTTKQNKNALQISTQKFTSIMSTINELLSKTLFPIALYRELTIQLYQINQAGIDLNKSRMNGNSNQDEFVDSWNSFILTFQKFLSEPTKNQLINFFDSHILSIQEVMDNISNYPPTNISFVPQWSSLINESNSMIKNIKTQVNLFKELNTNNTKTQMDDFSVLLKNFQTFNNNTKMFKLSSLTMSKREEAQFTVSKSTIKMLKYAEEFSKDQFLNGKETSLIKTAQKINFFVPQLVQIFSSKDPLQLKKLVMDKPNKLSKTSSVASRPNQPNQKVTKAEKPAANRAKQRSIKLAQQEEEENSNASDEKNDENQNAEEEENNEEKNEENFEEEENEDEDEADENEINAGNEEEENEENGDNDESTNFNLKIARKKYKFFKQKLADALLEEKALNDEVNEKIANLESSRKLLRSMKLTRSQSEAVLRKNEAIKTKADLEKQLSNLKTEVSKLEEKLKSKKDEHEEFLELKKELEKQQIENEFLKNTKKITSKYLRRLNPNNKLTSSSNSTVYVSELSKNLLAPAGITTASLSNQSLSTFNHEAANTVKKLQEELEATKVEYDKLMKERAVSKNADDDSNSQSLLKIYYDIKGFQEYELSVLRPSLQAHQIRNIKIAKESEIDSFFKSNLRAKKRQLKELEKENEEFNSKGNRQSILTKSSFYDQNSILNRSDIDPLATALGERSRLQQEYHQIQSGRQEEINRRRASIKLKLDQIPPIPEENIQLEEAAESLVYSRNQLKSALESNASALELLNEAVYTRDESEVAKMIARRRLEQLQIDFYFDAKEEKASKKKFELDQKKLKSEQNEEEEETVEEEDESVDDSDDDDVNEEEEKEEEDKESGIDLFDDQTHTQISKKAVQKTEKVEKTEKTAQAKPEFKIKFRTGKKASTKNKKQTSKAEKKKPEVEHVEADQKKEEKEATESKNDDKKCQEEEEEEEAIENNESEYDDNSAVPRLARLRTILNERVEMEEKLRQIEEIFSLLFGDRIPPKVSLSLTDKIELVMRQFNKTK